MTRWLALWLRLYSTRQAVRKMARAEMPDAPAPAKPTTKRKEK